MNFFRTRRLLPALVLSAALAGGTACTGSANTATNANGPIEYWLWDASQQPAYQQCADQFAAENPGLSVHISQVGWHDYWSKLTPSMIAGTAPDVFTNHPTKFAQYEDLKVLRPLDELAATADLKDADFQPGLGEVWKGRDGHRYGAPKDWDTIGIYYNVDTVKAAGVDPATLDNLTWNPVDGGTFEKVVAHLTVDANGRRGDEPGFDKTRVKVHGLSSDGGGGDNWGQTQWSTFAGSAGWRATDRSSWATRFNLDQPALQSTLEWYYGLARKGFMPTYNEIGGSGSNKTGVDKQVQAGSAVLGLTGSWLLPTFAKLTDGSGQKLRIGVAPTPIGPTGRRASMYNGLADSITTFSRQPENAAKWVKFLSSATCQNIVGRSGVVFPARPEGTRLAIEHNEKERGLDVSAFTDQVRDKTTFLFPVTSHGADITALTIPWFDALYIGSKPVSSLPDLNDQLNALLEIDG